MNRISVVIGDAHRSVAEALAARLDAEPDLSVVGVASTGSGIVDLVRNAGPDVLVIDADLPGEDAIGLAASLRPHHPHLEVVVVSAGDAVATAIRAVVNGALGFVPKEAGIEVLLDAVRGTRHRATHIPAQLLTGVLAELRGDGEMARLRDLLGSLSRREREVLELLRAGRRNDAIARELSLSPNTVRTHVQNLLGKLGVHSTVEAVAWLARYESAWPQSGT